MAKTDYCKCRYKHCRHGDEPLLKTDAVKEGNLYYHKDCYKTRENIKQIIKVYTEKVDGNPIYAYLNRVINDVIFKQNTDSNFLLFAIKKATEPGSSWKVRNPQGIPYLAKDEKLKKLWLDKERASKPKIRFEVLENTVAPSGYVPEKEKRIGDLFD